MPTFKPKKVGDFLRNRKLSGLRLEVEAQRKLLAQIRALLPAPVESHCAAAHIREGEMVLFTDSPAWASRLRYAVPDLLEKMREAGIPARSIRIRVTPNAIPPHSPPQKASRLSSANADLLVQVAATIADPALGAALRRLGRHRR